jgi:hypothetical protein
MVSKTKEVGKVVAGAEKPRYTIVKEISEAEAKSAFPYEIVPGRYKIGTLAVALFARGATNDEAFEAVKRTFPTSLCSTKKSYVTWYRNDAVKSGKLDAAFGPPKLVDPTAVPDAKPPTARKRVAKKKAATKKAATKKGA